MRLEYIKNVSARGLNEMGNQINEIYKYTLKMIYTKIILIGSNEISTLCEINTLNTYS